MVAPFTVRREEITDLAVANISTLDPNPTRLIGTWTVNSSAAPDACAVVRGRELTYYGRWTYKFEEAARRGATGAIIVHQTEPAGYGWDTVVNSWSTPQLDNATPDGNAGRVAVEGWITEAAAQALFEANGLSFADAVKRANTRGFRAEPLRSTASASFSLRATCLSGSFDATN